MRVIMTQRMQGSEDGIRVKLYEEGQTYDLGESLAQSFLGSKCARPVIEETKKAKGPAENK